MFTSGCRPWLKNVSCLSSLLSQHGPLLVECNRCISPEFYLFSGSYEVHNYTLANKVCDVRRSRIANK